MEATLIALAIIIGLAIILGSLAHWTLSPEDLWHPDKPTTCTQCGQELRR